jgi:hypothetical protein
VRREGALIDSLGLQTQPAGVHWLGIQAQTIPKYRRCRQGATKFDSSGRLVLEPKEVSTGIEMYSASPARLRLADVQCPRGCARRSAIADRQRPHEAGDNASVLAADLSGEPALLQLLTLSGHAKPREPGAVGG